MLLADAGVYTPVAVVLSTAAALLGALLGIVKLRGDTDSQAVSQAQGAMEVMQELVEALERDRDDWRQRYLACYEKRNELHAQVLTLEHELRRLRG
jgi:hypothetical protein